MIYAIAYVVILLLAVRWLCLCCYHIGVKQGWEKGWEKGTHNGWNERGLYDWKKEQARRDKQGRFMVKQINGGHS